MFDVGSYHKSLWPRSGHSIIALTMSFLSCLCSSGLLFMITDKARATGEEGRRGRCYERQRAEDCGG